MVFSVGGAAMTGGFSAAEGVEAAGGVSAGARFRVRLASFEQGRRLPLQSAGAAWARLGNILNDAAKSAAVITLFKFSFMVLSLLWKCYV